MKNKKATRYFSSKQESHVAKTLSGHKVVNSGATAFAKGDVTLDNWLIECKTCTSEKKSFSIKRDWIDKNKEEAFAMSKSYSAVCFNFGEAHNVENYYIIDEQMFKRLIKLIDAEDNDIE